MRKVYLDMLSNSRGTDDDYYYLIFDEENAELFVEYSWHYWKPRGPDQGSKKMSLAELKRKQPGVYSKAVAVITAVFPDVENQENMSFPLADSD